MAQEKPWVKLIRAKYLRGRRLLYATQLFGSSSWLWNCIKHCIPHLREVACFHIEERSTCKIIGDPWLPTLPGFRIEDDFPLDHRLRFIRDLMDSTGSCWDCRKIQANFPPHICSAILNTPILEKGQERLIWTPSMSRVFTVKSAFQLITKNRTALLDEPTRKTWNNLWNSQLHGRHKVLMWRILYNGLPTMERISTYIGGPAHPCYLCNSEPETTQHLLLQCPIVKLLWWNSPWQFIIEAFQNMDNTQWISHIYMSGNPLPGGETVRVGSRLFFILAFE